MRRLLLAALLLVAAVGVPSADAGRLTIRVTSITLSSKTTDRPPKGTSKGDTISFRDRLVNARPQFGRAKGSSVGSDRGTMTFTGAHDATFAGVAALPGGTLKLSGKVVALPGNSILIPVTGGTGRFRGAKGYVLVGPGAKRALNTYALAVPTIPVA
jgi:hypothetical protein